MEDVPNLHKPPEDFHLLLTTAAVGLRVESAFANQILFSGRFLKVFQVTGVRIRGSIVLTVVVLVSVLTAGQQEEKKKAAIAVTRPAARPGTSAPGAA